MGFLQNLGQGISNFVQGVGSTVGGVLGSVVGGVLNPVGQSGIVQQVANSQFGSALGSSLVPTGALGGIMPNNGSNMMDQMQEMLSQFVGGSGQAPVNNPYSSAQPKGNVPAGGDDVKWYKQKWFLPTAIGAGVLTLVTVLVMVFKKNKNKI